MGKKRIVTINESPEETPQTEEVQAVVQKEARSEKKKEKKPEKQEVHLPGLKGGQRVKMVVAEPLPEEEKPAATKPPASASAGKQKKAKPKRKRGKNYLAARTKVDPMKLYHLSEAIKLAKDTSWGKFDGSLEAHLVVPKKGLKGEVLLPYFAGKTKRVVIADEETLAKIESGKIDFDVLLSTPDFMPNLVKYAKVLGPKGLMPNPKAGTIVADPQKAREKFQKTSFSYKTESSAPLVHTVFGKVSQKDEELEANLQALFSAIGPKNIKRAIIKATMGPAVRVAVDNSSPTS